MAMGFLFAGVFVLWAASLTMPSLEAVEQQKFEQSTKIYDRTGQVLLYDLHQDVRRTVIPLAEMSPYIQYATIAIEDDNFYNHFGIEPLAIVRAVLTNIKNGDLLGGQGGSTITQQVVKNSLLVNEKKISRKLKEWVLALKLEREMEKDEILEMYLNVIPYGGTKYGIEEASTAYFGKSAKDLTVAEAAYLAALPQAPTYYLNNRDALEARKDRVLAEMRNHHYINEDEYALAMAERVEFLPQRDGGIKAPHFVFYVIEQLEEKYGRRAIEEEGFRVITTLDWQLQARAEEIVERYAIENTEKFNATNASLVAIDPKNGDILTMVGSRDYFDEEIDGNFNAALGHRQPGSSFKPFAYATAIRKGYTSETVVFDVPTQFSTACDPYNFTSDENCYSPVNYDAKYRGPMTFRNALAQSVNVPAVKVLYLAGMRDTLETAQRLGITTLTDWRRYGLTLVLGGGEVTLLEMTSAYSAFANEGERNSHNAILRIENNRGEVMEENEPEPRQVLDRDVALTITDMLADNPARTPAFGSNSYLYFPGRPVAAKTGTTNDYVDAWIIGYTPDIAVGAWAGNNDASSMNKEVAGFIVAPMWNEFLQEYFAEYPDVHTFNAPPPVPQDIKPILRGVWGTGGSPNPISVLASDDRPASFGLHSILHWVNKDDPRGDPPRNPASDPQYALWEAGVQRWASGQDPNSLQGNGATGGSGDGLQIQIREPDQGDSFDANDRIEVTLRVRGEHDPERAEYFVNGRPIGTSGDELEFTFRPRDVENLLSANLLEVVVYDDAGNSGRASVIFSVQGGN
jgi:1A family penicillin-binding protein